MTDAAGTQTGLIGRDEERRRLHVALERDGAALVTGEPGIGKTALLRAAIDATGRRRFEGGGFATLAWKPYLALALATSAALDGDSDWVATAVERIVGPDVLVIDDLQSVDPGTLAVLERLVGRVAVLCATRMDDEAGRAAVDALVAAGAERIDLPALANHEALALVARQATTVSAARAQRIVERAGGNPLLLEELAASGETASLRRAVARRLAALDPEDRAVVDLLAVADRAVPMDALGGRADRLAERSFLVATPDGATIRHALLADAVAAEMDASTRTAIHHRLAGLAATPGERARHLAAAGDRDGAHVAAREAAVAASSVGERAAHLGLAAATADGPDVDGLRVEAAAALRVAGDLAGALALLEAVEGADPELVARADAIRARVHWSAGDPEAMRAAVDRGLGLVAGTDSVAEAMLRAERVVVTALVDGHFEAGLAEAAAAVALAERVGSDETRPLLLRATLLAGLGMDGWDAALEAVVAAARASGDAETELSAANNLVAGHEMHGDPAVGRATATAMIERAEAFHLSAWARQFEAMLVNLDLHAGSLTAAVERAQVLLEAPLDPLAAGQVALALACALVDLGRVEEAGSIIDRLLAAAQDDAVARCGILHIAAERELWSGRPMPALQRVEAFRAYDAGDHPTSHLVDVVAGWAALDAGVSPPPRIATGEAEGMLAGAALERTAIEHLAAAEALSAADMFATAAAAYTGYHRRGELRARWASAEARRRAGDESLARRELESLELDADRQGFEPLAGRIRRSLRLLGVRRTARSATGPGQRRGVGGAGAGGGGTASAGSAAGAGANRDGRIGLRLTPREREIARLVAAGASNVEIARRLGLGRPTIARLLGSAMDKLGVDSRGQVAALVDAG